MLVVEDAHLIAVEVVRVLEAEGAAAIGPAANLRQALDLAREAGVEAGVMDVNIGGEMTFPAIELLRGRGPPLVLLMGHSGAGALPDRFRALPAAGQTREAGGPCRRAAARPRALRS